MILEKEREEVSIPAQQPAEHPFLCFDGTAAEAVDRPFTLREPRPEDYTAERHVA